MDKHLKAWIIIVFLVNSGLLLYGCTNQPTPPTIPDDNPAQIAQQPHANNSPKIIFNNVIDANNQFSLELYSKSRLQEGNLFFSPYSISSALAMTYEGAKGQTAEEMQAVLHLPEDKGKLHSDFLNIYNELNKAGKPYKLTAANALWVQKDYPFVNDYLSVVDEYYDGKATNLDFKAETEK